MFGNWRNFQEVEESLSLTELTMILETYYEEKANEREFQAALAGALPEKSEVATTHELESAGMLSVELEDD